MEQSRLILNEMPRVLHWEISRAFEAALVEECRRTALFPVELDSRLISVSDVLSAYAAS